MKEVKEHNHEQAKKIYESLRQTQEFQEILPLLKWLNKSVEQSVFDINIKYAMQSAIKSCFVSEHVTEPRKLIAILENSYDLLDQYSNQEQMFTEEFNFARDIISKDEHQEHMKLLAEVYQDYVE